jgi:hypothetical protein
MVLEYFVVCFLKGIERGLLKTVIEMYDANLRVVVIFSKINLVLVLMPV